jgi:lysophospholipase L1-like esterase
MKYSLIGTLMLAPFLSAAIASADDPASTSGNSSVDVSARKPVIFVCGDSTAKNSGNGKNGNPVAGWGTPIAAFFDSNKAVVNNVGHAGRSSMTYYNGDWPNVLPKINAGDFVLLVFGINDGSTPNGIGDDVRESANGQVQHTYGWYMSNMATDAQTKGAHVVLLTVTTRNIWRNPKVRFNDGTPIGELPADYDPKEDRIERGTSGGKYTQWTKEVGEKLHLPVFDLTNYCADQYEKMGREAVNKFYSDHNHTYRPGAEFVASSIVSGLKALKDSPFLDLLSAEGKALPAADAKYVSENAPQASSVPAASALQRSFEQPPENARIMVRWWWYGPAVTKPMLEQEMQTMKAGGIGGFEVQPTYPLSVDGELPGVHNIKFLSPEFFEMLRFTADKAKELGLRMDLTLGSGWPYGGPMFSKSLNKLPDPHPGQLARRFRGRW